MAMQNQPTRAPFSLPAWAYLSGKELAEILGAGVVGAIFAMAATYGATNGHASVALYQTTGCFAAAGFMAIVWAICMFAHWEAQQNQRQAATRAGAGVELAPVETTARSNSLGG